MPCHGRDVAAWQLLEPLHQALASVERPDTALTWMSRPEVSALIAQIGDDHELTHELLDELPADKTLAHLRSVLVAVGALPARDERLATLERWITTAIDAREDPAQRRILHGYAIWHHLRRLRQRLGDSHATHLQVLNIRCHVTTRRRSTVPLGRRGRGAPLRWDTRST